VRVQQRASRSTSDDLLAGVLAAGVESSHDPVFGGGGLPSRDFPTPPAPEMRPTRLGPDRKPSAPTIDPPLRVAAHGAVYLAEHGRFGKTGRQSNCCLAQHGFDPKTGSGRFQREMQAIAKALAFRGSITATGRRSRTNGWQYLVMEELPRRIGFLAAIVRTRSDRFRRR